MREKHSSVQNRRYESQQAVIKKNKQIWKIPPEDLINVRCIH